MDIRFKNEDWLLCSISRIARQRWWDGAAGLSDWSRLLCCVWEAYDMSRKKMDYHDFVMAKAFAPHFKREGGELARRLGLSETASVFDTPPADFPSKFGTRFDVVCDELRSVTEVKRN